MGSKRRYDYVSAIWRADANSNKGNVPAITRVLRKLVRDAIRREFELCAEFGSLSLDEALRIAKELIP